MKPQVSVSTASQLSAIILILTSSLLLGSCGSSENNVSKGNRTGTLHWGNGTEPQSLDPHIATGVPEHKIIMCPDGRPGTTRTAKPLSPDPAWPSPGRSAKTAESIPFTCGTMPAGPMATHTMPMTMSGPGGAHCSQHWAISMPICTSLLRMPKSITRARSATLSRWASRRWTT